METLNFKDLNLSKEVQKALAEMGFEEAMPIQAQAIPHIMEGRDVIGQAQTGTGKTCAFGIPAIEMVNLDVHGMQALVLCPTRELAIQVAEELKNVAKYKRGIKILPVYGGQPIERQMTALKSRPQIIVGTPGRVMDHMRRNTIKLNNLNMLILDEADEMLNMGFREDIDLILESVPQERQTILFSATMPREILELTKEYQKNAVMVKSVHKELTVPSIDQYYFEVRESNKLDVLSRIIDAANLKLVLVFCNTKKRVDDLTLNLQSRGYAAEALHGDMKQGQRDRVMSRFRKGLVEILIATDVAARGIDVDSVEAVVNYDIPNDEEYYVHRIGRTGRAGKTGKAFTFVSSRELYRIRDIQRYTKSTIRFEKPPSIMDVQESKISIVAEKLKNTIEEGNLSKYIGYIEKIIEDIGNEQDAEKEQDEKKYVTSLDIAAAFLKMTVGQSLETEYKEERKYEHRSYEHRNKEEYDFSDVEGEMVRLFVNVGRMDKIEPKNLIECIASNTRLPGKLIGAINILEKFTFIEVPKEYAAEVINTMRNSKIKGKRINVEKANKKQK